MERIDLKKTKSFSDDLICFIEQYLSGSNTVAKNFIMKKYTSKRLEG